MKNGGIPFFVAYWMEFALPDRVFPPPPRDCKNRSQGRFNGCFSGYVSTTRCATTSSLMRTTFRRCLKMGSLIVTLSILSYLPLHVHSFRATTARTSTHAALYGHLTALAFLTHRFYSAAQLGMGSPTNDRCHRKGPAGFLARSRASPIAVTLLSILGTNFSAFNASGLWVWVGWQPYPPMGLVSADQQN